MIKGIAKIKGLGVYENYVKPAETKDFGIKNLIYGWNYSGKTTLSRVFAQIEAKKQNPDLLGCEFTFDTDDLPITEKNFSTSDLMVRVFNSDFVRENLHFDGSNFSPILLLGKDSEEAQQKIDRFTARIKRSEAIERRIEGKKTSLSQAISNAKTDAAKQIRQLLKIDPYTAVHLGNDAQAIRAGESKILAEKDLSDDLELALTPDSKRPTTVDKLALAPTIKHLHEEALTVLESTPNFSNTLKHLEDHPEIEQWVELGLQLHPKQGECEFCGNTITEERLATFRAHFSKDLIEHKKKIENLLARVKAAEVKPVSLREGEFNPQYRDSYKAAAATLPAAISAFNEAVTTLADDVQRKVKNPHKFMKPAPLVEGLSEAISAIVSAINSIVEENNKLADNFVASKKDATTRVKYHHVQQFVDSQNSSRQERTMAQLDARRSRLQKYSAAIRDAISSLRAQISQAQLGREKINERLASMLGSEAVQIMVVKESQTNQERFLLVRKNGKPAKNLSDGERTAIALAYFLTKLQELKPEDFKQTIVYIDDPISSLDANHIFQVAAAIRSLFFYQESFNEPWQTTCKQIFISTHSFEFFNLLREIKPVDAPKACLFFIERVSGKTSTFRNMPKSLALYQSEYHFLFEVIYKFHKAPDKTDYAVLMLLPNAIRRFIELYTYSRLPGNLKQTVDQRAEALFGTEKAKRILKIFHYFSHANTIDRLAGNNELIFDVEHAVNDLVEAITQTDEKHMNSLVSSVT